MSHADDTPPVGAPAPAPAPASYPAALNHRKVDVEDTLLASDRATPRGGVEDTGVARTLVGITGSEHTLAGPSGLGGPSEQPYRPADLRREIPARIGRYLVIGPLGEGGMGVIFAAYDPQLDRKVAIKLVRPAYTESNGGEAQARLVREAQALARLRHPNIVTVYEVGAYGDEVYVAMEFVDGVTLRTWQFEHARSWREVLRVYQAAGRGLAAAHRGGLVHRDFKPDNVLVTRDGEPRVLDFGLAFSDASPTVGGHHHAAALDAQLTVTGALVGTPAYMSPEQFSGKNVDARTDVFAFCVALYEALYGGRPYAGTTVAEICVALEEGRVSPPPPFVKIPAWLRRAVLRGLKIDPKERLQDMDAVLRAIGRDPARWLAIASVVLVVGGVIAALVLALRSAEGQQSLRDQGARARADFDHLRAEALERELLGDETRAASERFDQWVVAAARARVEKAPTEALAALKHLRGEAALAGARGVAIEALARGIPEHAWSTEAPVGVVAFAGGDRWVVSGDARGRIEVRTREGEVIASSEQRAAITALAVASIEATGERPTLRIAALADGELSLWDVAADTRRTQRGEAAIVAVALAPDGSQFATGAGDGRLRVHAWTGETLHTYADHGAAIGALAWSGDGRWLASGDADGELLLWNLAAETHRELGVVASVQELRFDAASRRLLAVGVRGGTAWTIDEAAPRASSLPELRSIRAAEDTQLELGTTGELTLRVDDAPARRLVSEAPARAIDLDPAARRAVVAHARGVELWDARGRRDRSLPGAGLRLGRLLFAPDGQFIAGTTDDGGLQVWHVETGARTVLRAAGPEITDLFFRADGSELVAVEHPPNMLAWDPRSEQPTARVLPLITDWTAHVFARPLADGGLMQWHTTGSHAVFAASSASGEPLWRSPELDPELQTATLSADGRRLIVAPRRGRPSLFRIADGSLQPVPVVIGGADHRWAGFADTADGARSRLAAAIEGGSEVTGFVVWEVAWDGAEPPTPHVLYEDDEVRAVLGEPAGAAVIVRGDDRSHLWQLASGAIDLLPSCVAELHGFALAPDGGRVVLVGNDRVSATSETACFVDLASGASHRLRIAGAPWAWDGRRTLASVGRGAVIELAVDPTPAEPAAFLAWLAQQTARRLPLTALAP